MKANIEAALLLRSKEVLSDGAILEMIVWKTPAPVAGSRHLFKYRLYFGRDGVRRVGFDNDCGKDDHRHLDGVEKLYEFIDVDTLVADFLAAVRERSGRR